MQTGVNPGADNTAVACAVVMQMRSHKQSRQGHSREKAGKQHRRDHSILLHLTHHSSFSFRLWPFPVPRTAPLPQVDTKLEFEYHSHILRGQFPFVKRTSRFFRSRSSISDGGQDLRPASGE